MLELVGKQHADILCFQEFYEPADTVQNPISGIYSRKLEFPYFFFSRDFHNHLNKYESGSIIFSKYPIIATDQIFLVMIPCHKKGSLIFTDLNVNGKNNPHFYHPSSICFI